MTIPNSDTIINGNPENTEYVINPTQPPPKTGSTTNDGIAKTTADPTERE